MNPGPILAELKFEFDSLYVSTEMILSRRLSQPPLDGLLLEACLLHFRVVWDFFYQPEKLKPTDVVVRDLIPTWTETERPEPPARLREIRKWLNVMLAHLTTHRVDPEYKAGEISTDDIQLIRAQTLALFNAFQEGLDEDPRRLFANPLKHKFSLYETLNP